jgi:hypothetical protein
VADETFRSQIVIDITDNSGPGLQQAQARLDSFTAATNQARAGVSSLNAVLRGARTAIDAYAGAAGRADRASQGLAQNLPRIGQAFGTIGASGAAVSAQMASLSTSMQAILTQLRALSARQFNINVNANTTNAAASALTRVASAGRSSNQALNALASSFLGVSLASGGLVAGLQLVARGFDSIIAKPVELADAITRARLSFDLMFEKMDRPGGGDAFFQRVQDFAVKTPFSMQEVITGAQRLITAGVSPERVINEQGGGILKKVGDAVAASGGQTAQVERVLQGFARVYETGRFGARAVQQLTNANIPAWKLLAEGYQREVAPGQSIEAIIPMIRGMAERNQLPMRRGMRWLEEGLERNYGGSMERTANLTFGGVKEQIQDAFNVNVVARWGKGLQEGAIPNLSLLQRMLFGTKETTQGWGDALERAGHTLSGMTLGAITAGFAIASGDEKNIQDAFYNLGRTVAVSFGKGLLAGIAGGVKAFFTDWSTFEKVMTAPGRIPAQAAMSAARGILATDEKFRTPERNEYSAGPFGQLAQLNDIIAGWMGHGPESRRRAGTAIDDSSMFTQGTMTQAELQAAQQAARYRMANERLAQPVQPPGHGGGFVEKVLDLFSTPAGAAPLESDMGGEAGQRPTNTTSTWERAAR